MIKPESKLFWSCIPCSGQPKGTKIQPEGLSTQKKGQEVDVKRKESIKVVILERPSNPSERRNLFVERSLSKGQLSDTSSRAIIGSPPPSAIRERNNRGLNNPSNSHKVSRLTTSNSNSSLNFGQRDVKEGSTSSSLSVQFPAIELSQCPDSDSDGMNSDVGYGFGGSEEILEASREDITSSNFTLSRENSLGDSLIPPPRLISITIEDPATSSDTNNARNKLKI